MENGEDSEIQTESENIIQTIDFIAVYLMRYGTRIIDWRQEEQKDIDRKLKKYFTMHSNMHLQSDMGANYTEKEQK